MKPFPLSASITATATTPLIGPLAALPYKLSMLPAVIVVSLLIALVASDSDAPGGDRPSE
jgi:hypothetical protein